MVIVHEADKSTGKRVQRVEIPLNFIGNFVVPYEEAILSPEQIEANEKLEERRGYCREKMRNYRSRQKAKSAAEKIESETAV